MDAWILFFLVISFFVLFGFLVIRANSNGVREEMAREHGELMALINKAINKLDETKENAGTNEKQSALSVQQANEAINRLSEHVERLTGLVAVYANDVKDMEVAVKKMSTRSEKVYEMYDRTHVLVKLAELFDNGNEVFKKKHDEITRSSIHLNEALQSAYRNIEKISLSEMDELRKHFAQQHQMINDMLEMQSKQLEAHLNKYALLVQTFMKENPDLDGDKAGKEKIATLRTDVERLVRGWDMQMNKFEQSQNQVLKVIDLSARNVKAENERVDRFENRLKTMQGVLDRLLEVMKKQSLESEKIIKEVNSLENEIKNKLVVKVSDRQPEKQSSKPSSPAANPGSPPRLIVPPYASQGNGSANANANAVVEEIDGACMWGVPVFPDKVQVSSIPDKDSIFKVVVKKRKKLCTLEPLDQDSIELMFRDADNYENYFAFLLGKSATKIVPGEMRYNGGDWVVTRKMQIPANIVKLGDW